MKTYRIGLTMVAAIALAVPLWAAQKDAAPSDTPASAEQNTAKSALPDAPSVTRNAAGNEAEKPSGDPQSHRRFMSMRPVSSVVDDASTARPLTVGEKWRLYGRQTVAPFHFVEIAIGAGISQAEDRPREYGQGMEGYAKRYGSKFADSSFGSFFGSFLLPSITHDDPRYFRMGTGSVMHRTVYAASRVLITRHDDGTRRFAYAHLLGNFIGASFSNLYYPERDTGAGDTFRRAGDITLGDAANNVFKEFWPDIRRKLHKKHKPDASQAQTGEPQPSDTKPGTAK